MCGIHPITKCSLMVKIPLPFQSKEDQQNKRNQEKGKYRSLVHNFFQQEVNTNKKKKKNTNKMSSKGLSLSTRSFTDESAISLAKWIKCIKTWVWLMAKNNWSIWSLTDILSTNLRINWTNGPWKHNTFPFFMLQRSLSRTTAAKFCIDESFVLTSHYQFHKSKIRGI